MSHDTAATVIAAFAAVGMLGLAIASAIRAALGSVRKEAKRDGKIDEVLVRLTDMAEDHEKRLRKGGL